MTDDFSLTDRDVLNLDMDRQKTKTPRKAPNVEIMDADDLRVSCKYPPQILNTQIPW